MKIHPLLYLFLALTVSSCISVEPLTVKSVSCCELKKALKTETEVAFEIDVENPNPFPITLKSYDLAVRVNGNEIGNAADKTPIEIPANSSFSKSITVTTSTQKLISGTLMMGLTALLKKDPTTLEIEVLGAVVGKAKGFSKRVRIKESYPLKLHP